jgi:2-polyprenyl-3-methyl-5-hydroxy-6-metoxy-1,4-benzoquinol methylase
VHIDIRTLHARFLDAQRGKRSRHSVSDRTRPSLSQYDYLSLRALSEDIRILVGEIPVPMPGARALDLGSDKCPFRSIVAGRGFGVVTMDISLDSGADYEGRAEHTNLPDESFDLVLCTQVLEHCSNPWKAISEIRRILTPGGHAILSAPHVWFYHPHPADHWRFTQEGIVRLCQDGGLTPVTLLAQGGTVLNAFQIVNFLAYGILGRLGAPFYAVINLLGMAGDRLFPNDLFCGNFACLARRA